MREITSILTERWEIPFRRRIWLWERVTPERLFVASFALMVLGGTLGLKLLPGLYTGPELSWVNAFFTATSAVCVTGLVVVDTATYFTPLGQAYLLLLIQLGGLGMITFTTVIIVALGRRMSLRHEALSLGGTDAAPQVDRRGLVRDVVRFTFIIELLGAMLLYATMAPTLGWREAIWHSVFQSVSAFCNAGFTTFEQSMVRFQQRPQVLGAIILLMMLGAIGFLTIEEIYLRYRAGRQRRIFRLSLHSRIVLLTSAVLIVSGAVLLGWFEWNGTLSGLPVISKCT
ncbi:MAG: potassium transporter TrkG, partial [Phycisphaerales bacterium]|nr:potassium transporter TrkG [Phycisphaerales bacterium]